MLKQKPHFALAPTLLGAVAIFGGLATILGFFIWILPNSCRAGIVQWGVCDRFSTPTATSEPPELDARETIYQYFSFLNKDDPQCASAWALLSHRFQLEENQGDLTRYCVFWDGVKEVEPVEVVEVQVGEDSAVFLVTLHWVPGEGVPYDRTYRYSLIRGLETGSWLIDATEGQ